MAIIQISKIQVRSGNLVDLPQLDEAEFGWASDAKRLFIGDQAPIENVEVLTGYSQISFSQIDGSVGNLNIDANTLANGQILTYDGNNWVNRGGSAGGLINLGNVENVKIGGGAIGYVLETDGSGNLSWTSKGVITLLIQNITQSTNAVITFAQPFALSSGQAVTITDVEGMTQVNSNTYYLGNITSTTANLYIDQPLTTPLDSSGFSPYTSNGKAVATIINSSALAAGATNSVQYNNAGILAGSANLTFTGSNLNLTGNLFVTGNVGIGIVNPAYKFVVSNSGAQGFEFDPVTGIYQVYNRSTLSYGEMLPYASNIRFFTGASPVERVSINSNGEVVVNKPTSGIPLTTNGVEIAFATTGEQPGYTQGAIALNSGTDSSPEGRGQGVFMWNYGKQATWYMGTAYANADIFMIGRKGSTVSVDTSTAQTTYADLTIDSAGNVTLSGSLLTTALTTGASATNGTITGNWTLSSGSKLEATYADLAEYYHADQSYDPGTVLEFGGNFEVTVAEDATNRVAGVVSSNPAYVMNATCKGEHVVAIALQGRVPVKVKGKIRKGDMMISAGNGYARPSNNPTVGSVIGKSLENFDGAEGIIEIAIGRL